MHCMTASQVRSLYLLESYELAETAYELEQHTSWPLVIECSPSRIYPCRACETGHKETQGRSGAGPNEGGCSATHTEKEGGGGRSAGGQCTTRFSLSDAEHEHSSVLAANFWQSCGVTQCCGQIAAAEVPGSATRYVRN